MTRRLTALPKVSFAQKPKLTDQLHQLVRSYPRGLGIIHEFIQNADDAGATTLSVFLDERQFPDGDLPSESMSCLQGPALVVVNDASFSEDDWDRIQSTGRSGKILDASKTGRFGLGFNSVYNVTDWPAILTLDRIGIFDPHGETVEGASRDDPGAAWILGPELWSHCADLLLPFEKFGLPSGAGSIGHTIFRLPLRTDEAAQRSEICNEKFTPQNFYSLVDKLRDEAGELLLFLKNLIVLHVGVITCDGSTKDLVTIRTINSDEVAESRGRVHRLLEGEYKGVLELLREADPADLASEYDHKITIECTGVGSAEQIWSVVQALATGPNEELLNASLEMFNFEEKAVPLVGAAALAKGKHQSSKDSGRLFCTLPLSSVASYLPFHINGFFDLQSDRQGLFSDGGAEGKGAARVQWNKSLLQFGCSQVAARLLHRIAKIEAVADAEYRYWPTIQGEARALLQYLPSYVYQQLGEYECMPCGIDHRLTRPREVLLLPPSEPVTRQALLEDGLPLANPVPPHNVVQGFKYIGAALRLISPEDLRNELRVDEEFNCALSEAPRASLRTKDRLLAILRYCCSDGVLAELTGVPLALTADGALQAFGLGADPLYIPDLNERSILAELPHLLLDLDIVGTQGFGSEPQAAIREVTPDELISLIPKFLSNLNTHRPVFWDPAVSGMPCEQWLVNFYSYLADHSDDCDLTAEILRELPLVPDQFGSLWPMGLESTPLLPSTDRTQGGCAEFCVTG